VRGFSFAYLREMPKKKVHILKIGATSFDAYLLACFFTGQLRADQAEGNTDPRYIEMLEENISNCLKAMNVAEYMQYYEVIFRADFSKITKEKAKELTAEISALIDRPKKKGEAKLFAKFMLLAKEKPVA